MTLSRPQTSNLFYDLAISHSAIGEREAAFRAISFAELVETPILIAHVSSGSVVEEIRRAQAHAPSRTARADRNSDKLL
jgi:dihydroorotase-like cyclic amidohydrolase